MMYLNKLTVKQVIMKNNSGKLFRIPTIIGTLVFLCFSVQAQFSETREFVKRFKVGPDTKFEITNKYGRIELNKWEKDSVVIRFRMEINEKKKDRLEKTLNNLDFDITNTGPYLIVKTQVDKNQSQLESEFNRFKETILQTSGSVRIDLKIWLPDHHNLRLENKFGDIVMDDYKGETQVILSNGKLICGELAAGSSVDLNFADATIDKLTDARITSNYSDIQLQNAGTLRFESKSSTIEITESHNLRIESRRDKFRLRNVNQMDATGSFSQFRVEDLKAKATLHLSYGSFSAEKVAPSFSIIYIDARMADLNLYFSPEAKFNYQITESKTNLNLGRIMKDENKETLDPKENKIRHVGYFGKKMKEDQLIINAVGGETNISDY